MSLEQAAITVIGVLWAAVCAIILWVKAWLDRIVKRLEAKIDECEADREKLWHHLASLGHRKTANFSLKPKSDP